MKPMHNNQAGRVFARRIMRGIAVLGFATLGALSVAQAAIVVHDDAGRRISLPRPAQRIVSLAPHATEMIFAAGGGDRLVGAVRFSDYPQAARKIPRVGDYLQIDIERVVALKPDLVVAWGSGNSARQLAQLEQLGIPVFYSEPRSLNQIPQTILNFGKLMGTEKIAQNTAAAQRRELSALREQFSGRPRVRVFYQIWDRPLQTLNGQHIVSEALRLCGGENVFASLSVIAPTVSIEGVLQKNPEAIIGGIQADERPVTGSAASPSAPKTAKGLEMWQRYPGLRAVAHGNLLAIDADLLSRSGPRLIAGTAALCELLEQARSRRSGQK